MAAQSFDRSSNRSNLDSVPLGETKVPEPPKESRRVISDSGRTTVHALQTAETKSCDGDAEVKKGLKPAIGQNAKSCTVGVHLDGLHDRQLSDSVKSVIISDDDVTNEHRGFVGGSGYHDNRLLRFVENRPSRLRCVAFGGYPAPTLHLYVGRREETDRFSAAVESSLAGERGLRQIRLRTERWTDSYSPSSEDDGHKLKCIAIVTEMNSYTEFVHISVEYGPKLSCVGAEAYVGERNAVLKCEIKAKPPPTRFTWVVDANGTTITDETIADKTSDFHVITAVRSDDVIETQLIIRHIRLDLFRNYSLLAENTLSASTKDVFLSQKYNTYRSRDPVPDVSSRRISSYADLRRGTIASSSSSPHLLIHLPSEHLLQTLRIQPHQLAIAIFTLILILTNSITFSSTSSSISW